MARDRMLVIKSTLLGIAAAVIVAPAWADNGRNVPVRFVEVAGSEEFSGSMIARPVPAADWQARGLSAAAANRTYAAAVDLIRTQFANVRHVPQTDQYIFDLPGGPGSENEAADAILATGLFRWTHPNWTVYPLDCPNDSRFNEQWHHQAQLLNSCDGWDTHTGNPTTAVGICDTGIRVTHEDLLLNRLEGYNAVDRRWEHEGGQINDIYGHGTETTGCAAANGDNARGGSGVGWNLSHRMLRVTNSSGGGSSIEVLDHAAMTAVENGDKVASLSYSGVDTTAVYDTATYIKSIGGLMIWAAGNSSQNMTRHDRDADDVLIIGATDRFDGHAGFSNYGPLVDFVAPGVDVFTTAAQGDTLYHEVSGTSFACPLTSGLAALVWSYDPSLQPDDVEWILKNSCDDLGSLGIDNTFGYGRIEVNAALALAGGQLPIRLEIDDLISGEVNAIAARNATPALRVYFIYSLTGTGSTFVPPLNVTLGLADPQLAFSVVADANGRASANVTIPSAGGGLHVWIQAAEQGRVSDVLERDIQ